MKNDLHKQKKGAILRFCVWLAFIGLWPSVAIAQEGLWTDEGKYTVDWINSQESENEYIIDSAEDFAAFIHEMKNNNTFAGKDVKVKKDIDLSNHSFAAFREERTIFEGSFDGGNYKLKNIILTLNDEYGGYTDGVGYGVICQNQGTIKNITFTSPQITGKTTNTKSAVYIGLIGTNQGIIDGCHVENINLNVSGEIYAGGLVGYNNGYEKSALITNCTVQGEVTTNYRAGGICGCNYKSSIKYCQNYAAVTADYASGILGSIDGGNISDCSNKGKIQGDNYSAGIIGYIKSRGEKVTVSYCYNTSGISDKRGSSSSGGIIASVNTETNVYSCFNTGDILGDKAGGIIGEATWPVATLSNCYNSGVISARRSCYAGGGIIGYSTSMNISNCFNVGRIITPLTANRGIGGIATGTCEISNCLVLGKSTIPALSSSPLDKIGRIGNTSSITYKNNYASAHLLIQSGDYQNVAIEALSTTGRNGANWDYSMAEPINSWPADAWDKSDNTILPQLKYADGTLMPDQPQLLKSDYATETPSDPVDPSDATLKSLSYKIGEDGEVIPVPGFQPDVFHYQISYDKSLAGSAFYAIAEANNPEASVTTVRNDALGRGFVSVSVESEDGKESRTYSIFGVEAGDEDKCYLVLNLGSHMGDHMALELNGKAFRGDAVYKAVPGEQIVGKLVPDKGYKLPAEITEFDGFMMGFIQRGETDMYASDGTIRFTLNGHKLLYASAQEGEEPSSPSDATLKSLSYKIGEDGEVIPVPGFQPDVFHYQISYDKSLTGSAFYAVAEANNPKATVDAGGGDLGKRSALILVESEDKSEGGTYSIFGVESGDEDKRYLVFNLGDHLAFLLNGKEFRGNDVYKGVPGEEIVGKLVPDRGYRLPTEISVHDVFMSSIQRGETDLYTYDGTIRLTLDRGTCIYASAQEGEETDPPSVGSKLTDEPFVYEVLPENRLKLLHPTQSSEEWRVSSCDVPASVRYRGVGYQVTEIGNNAFEDYTNLKIITLSEGLLSIGAFAFDNSGLTRLSLPASVTFIGDEEGDWDLFGDCPNLQAVTVAEGSKTYSASDSILYNKDRSRLILCPPACPHSEVRVPDEVKEIMPYAFAYSKNVAGLTLPAGLEKIGEFAFASSALGKEKSYIRCLGEQPVTFEDTEFLLLLSSTQEEESYLLASNNGKYPCTLYVPAGTKAAYEAAFFWKNFPIQEELPSGDVTISGGDGKIEVEDENGEKVEVEDGVIGNDDLPTVIERISIDIRASSSETTKLVFKQVTVGDGQIVTQETTTTTEIKEETNVSITIEGENVLGKLVNNGIAALLTGSKDGSLSNTVVVNYNTFTSETKLVSKVEGTAPLDVSDPENKTVVAGGATTLVASTTVESSFNLTFVWERWVDGAWQKVEERKYENLLRSSADKQEDKLTVSAADAGLYRCRITNTVGDVSTTLITTPAEVKLTSSGGDPTPTPDYTYYDVTLPQVTGATMNPAAGKYTVKEGDSFSFTLTLDAAYSQSKLEVKAGDQMLIADANGKYTIPKVSSDLTVTITGITLNSATANAELEQPVKVWAEGHTLYVYTATRETIRLYTFSGQLLRQVDNEGRIAIPNLPEGNYLIRIGNRTWKISL